MKPALTPRHAWGYTPLMKRSVLLVVAVSLLAFASHAELKIPSSVFTIDELEEAKKEAAEEKEPLVFVYTDPGTT